MFFQAATNCQDSRWNALGQNYYSSCSQLSSLRFHLIVISIGSIGALTGATAGRFRPIATTISSCAKERVLGIRIKKFPEVGKVAKGAALVISNCCQESNHRLNVTPHGFQATVSFDL